MKAIYLKKFIAVAILHIYCNITSYICFITYEACQVSQVQQCPPSILMSIVQPYSYVVSGNNTTSNNTNMTIIVIIMKWKNMSLM